MPREKVQESPKGKSEKGDGKDKDKGKERRKA